MAETPVQRASEGPAEELPRESRHAPTGRGGARVDGWGRGAQVLSQRSGLTAGQGAPGRPQDAQRPRAGRPQLWKPLVGRASSRVVRPPETN